MGVGSNYQHDAFSNLVVKIGLTFGNWMYVFGTYRAATAGSELECTEVVTLKI